MHARQGYTPHSNTRLGCQYPLSRPGCRMALLYCITMPALLCLAATDDWSARPPLNRLEILVSSPVLHDKASSSIHSLNMHARQGFTPHSNTQLGCQSPLSRPRSQMDLSYCTPMPAPLCLTATHDWAARDPVPTGWGYRKTLLYCNTMPAVLFSCCILSKRMLSRLEEPRDSRLTATYD